MKVAVAGGTGVVGRFVTERLSAGGHDPVVLARAVGVDLLSGDGLADHLDGVEAVVDVTSVVTTRSGPATEFFTRTSGNLLTAGYAAGVRHHVLLSIVGIDVVPFGYYEGKVAQEHLVEDGKVPYTIVRATQFHEFAGQMAERARVGPVVMVPKMLSATIAADEVAAHLVELATSSPRGRSGDVTGPETHEMADLTRRWLRHHGDKRPVLGARLPGRAGKLMASGALVPADPAVVGRQTFAKWLDEQR